MNTDLLKKTYTPSKEAAAAMDRAIAALIGKPLSAGLRQLVVNQVLTDELLTEVQNLLDIRMRALIVEGKTLRLVNGRLARHKVMITGIRANRDPDDEQRVAFTPVIKELV